MLNSVGTPTFIHFGAANKLWVCLAKKFPEIENLAKQLFEAKFLSANIEPFSIIMKLFRSCFSIGITVSLYWFCNIKKSS